MEKKDDKKLYIILGILVICILVVLRSLIVGNKNAIVNYSKINTGYDIVAQSEEINDREIYYIIESILSKLVNSYRNFNEYDIGEYYDVLDKSYKSKISQSEYLDLINVFMEKLKVVSEGNMELQVDYVYENSIKGIYEVEEDSYIAMISAEQTGEVGYIGVTLNQDKNTFQIFYIE